jgi:hypothetical protein
VRKSAPMTIPEAAQVLTGDKQQNGSREYDSTMWKL